MEKVEKNGWLYWNTFVQVDVDGTSVPCEVQLQPRTWRKNLSWREYSSAPRIYVGIEGETILENLANRRNRDYTTYRKIVQQATKQVGFKSLKMGWSQYAGCSCPCSPGFKVKDWDWPSHPESGNYWDMWVVIGRVKSDPVVDLETQFLQLGAA